MRSVLALSVALILFVVAAAFAAAGEGVRPELGVDLSEPQSRFAADPGAGGQGLSQHRLHRHAAEADRRERRTGEQGAAARAHDGKIVFTKTIKVNLGSGITPLFSEPFDTKTLKGTYQVKAEITADDGSPVTVNADSFDVFTAAQRAVPKQRLAVLDPSNSLKPFLRQAGFAFVEFDATTDRSLAVFVSRTEATTPEQRNLFAALTALIKAGGTAVYLQGGGPNAKWGVAGKASPSLPVSARSKQAIGTWTGIPHLVKGHPIFEGFPVNRMTRNSA